MDRAVIDRFFADVPPALTRELVAFAADHPPRRAEVRGTPVEYFASGSGSRTLLLLPGLLGNAASLYRQILDFERDHRVIAITYPELDDVEAQIEAVSTVLGIEGADRVVVVGQTLGGYVGQAWAWRHPERVEGLALVHAGLPDPRLGERVAGDARRARLLPSFVLRRYLLSVLLRMVASLRARGEVEEDQARLAAARFRHRFARLVDKPRILTRYRLISRLHAMPVPAPAELERFCGRVLVLHAEGNVFTRDLGRLREHYPGAREVTLGRGHNIAFLIFPEASNRALREFLDRLEPFHPTKPEE